MDQLAGNPQLQETLNIIYFIAYVFLIMAIFLRIGFRYAMYRLLGLVPPYLIYRELVLFGTVGLVLGLLLFLRASGASPLELRSSFLWTNGSAIAVILGLGYYAYVEWFKVEAVHRSPNGEVDERRGQGSTEDQ